MKNNRNEICLLFVKSEPNIALISPQPHGDHMIRVFILC
ncbi:Uncharacterised protein [Chlamydia abortus]|nr:uncharacterized protein CHAB577_0993 [Chlamydia abortus]SFZ99447.1 Uncharacterised protein [Chlamydia abortus]SGA01744.1 Uncharacterised protein [Chlamydia abortus]SGA08170.1 Uncharacterised protein [Chlamydia abortus]SGA13450.1 Uncharacterised protein [Chlamydia abortus]